MDDDLSEQRHQWIADHVLPWEREVRRWCGNYRRTLRTSDIDDLIQEAYVRLWGTNFTHIRNGRSFFYSVVRNALRDQLRRAKVVQIECVGVVDELLVGEAPSAEHWLNAHQDYERLLRALEMLTLHQRTVYELRKFQGLSQREIGSRLGITPKTVENLLRLAHARVMAVMVAEGNDCASERRLRSDEGRRDRPARRRSRSRDWRSAATDGTERAMVPKAAARLLATIPGDEIPGVGEAGL